MAAAAEVLLLVALASNMHADVLQRAGYSHRFVLDKPADFCSISRWTGEEKELLRNSSVSHDSSQGRGTFYQIFPLKVSDSGQYQEQCWTQGSLTHERNSTLLVCDDQKMSQQSFSLNVGQTVELTCDGVGPNQSVLWAYENWNHKRGNEELAIIDDEAFPGNKLQLVKKESSLLLTANVPLAHIAYYCLEKSRQRCDLLRGFHLLVSPEFILRSVGESLELTSSRISGNQSHAWMKDNSVMEERTSHNDTLTFPSLTLNHSGLYSFQPSGYFYEHYYLLVCPEPEPPAVVLFTGGENLTLQCGDWKQTDDVLWFLRSNRTEGRVSRVHPQQQPDNMHLSDVGLVITDISLEDSGEFWCVVLEWSLCVFRSETLVRFREPEVDHHLVRSVLVSAAIMMCVLIVAVVWSTRSREQLPVPVEEVQMSDLSPASADLPRETPVWAANMIPGEDRVR